MGLEWFESGTGTVFEGWRTVSGALGGPVKALSAMRLNAQQRGSKTYLISNLGALGAMFLSIAGPGSRDLVEEVANCRRVGRS